jgi:hypothetical protein
MQQRHGWTTPHVDPLIDPAGQTGSALAAAFESTGLNLIGIFLLV